MATVRASLPAGLRLAVMGKTLGACWYCGECANGRLHLDHMQPVSKGGRDEPENLVPSRKDCNLLKGDKTVEEFRAEVRARMEKWAEDAFALLDGFRWYLPGSEERRRQLASLVEVPSVVIFYGEAR